MCIGTSCEVVSAYLDPICKQLCTCVPEQMPCLLLLKHALQSAFDTRGILQLQAPSCDGEDMRQSCDMLLTFKASVGGCTLTDTHHTQKQYTLPQLLAPGASCSEDQDRQLWWASPHCWM